MSILQKRQKLESIIKGYGSAVVAFSGGVDSTLVLAVARSMLGDKVVAVTAQSPSLPQRELEAAKNISKSIGVEHLIIQTNEMDSAEYRENPVNRCYYCKSELYSQLKQIANDRDFAHILNGINSDDMGDHRPGIAAAKESDVMSPLYEAGFSKEDVRAVSRELNLSTWEKPAMACLSSRIPYGESISPEKLFMVEQAEDYLLSLGFRQLRVRHHGEVARIELVKEDIPKFFANGLTLSVQNRFKEIGFKYVSVDIEGYRSGSLNEAIKTG